MRPQQHRDREDQAVEEPQGVTFGPEWTVMPRVAISLLGTDRAHVERLIKYGILRVQYEGKVRLIELDSVFAYRRRKAQPRPAAHPADLDTDKDRTHEH